MQKKNNKYAFCNYYDELNFNNFLFENKNTKIGDNLLSPFVRLKELAEELGINVSTTDSSDLSIVDGIVFIDMPNLDNKYFNFACQKNIPMYLIILESKHTRFQNYEKNNYKYFKKIFTYDDDLVDDVKFIKINYSFELPKAILRNTNRNKLCTMIAGNKKSTHHGELYSKREDIVRWFEKNHPLDFDLYGIGWDRYTFKPYPVIKYLNKSQFLRKFLYREFISYRGQVERKIPILQNYKFSICYENIADVPGYITEKIFDSMIAGCIPIYRGAPNITDHIPENCFIDARNFQSISDLYRYISKIDEQSATSYLNNMETFFNSEKGAKFSLDQFSKTILDGLSA
jgi:hypothetical protein